MTQSISDRVWRVARERGAESGIVIYARDIDPEGDGRVNLDLMRAFISKEIPPGRRGFVAIDIETPYFRQLKEDPATDAFRSAEREMLKALRLGKSMRPEIKWGFYGLPSLTYWIQVPGERWPRGWDRPTDELRRTSFAQATRPHSLLAEVDWLAPSIYDFYDNSAKEGIVSRDRGYVTTLVKLARAVAGERPVLPFVKRRYHHNGRPGTPPAFAITPVEEFTQHVQWAIDAGADGVVWWGSDDYYVRLAGLSRGPRDGDFDARTQARWRELLAAEREPGVAIRDHMDRVHTQTLTILTDVVFGTP